MQIDFIFSIIILIMSVVVHEVSHGYAAYLQGDNTAKYQGRLTLNPLKHLDLFGSIILPILSYLGGGFIIGWAKPVPYNPYNLRNGRWGEFWVAAAGPLSNIALALIFGLALRFDVASAFGAAFANIALSITVINLVLATFNLIPIPPLDGSKILFAFLPYSFEGLRRNLEQYGTILLIIFVIFLWQAMLPLVGRELKWIVGPLVGAL